MAWSIMTLSNVDILELLEENTIDFLLLDYDGGGLDIDTVEDEDLKEALYDAKDALYAVRGILDSAADEYYEND
jgi:hypothetical protein